MVPDINLWINQKLLLLSLGLMMAIPHAVVVLGLGKPAQGQHLQDREHSLRVDVNLVLVRLSN